MCLIDGVVTPSTLPRSLNSDDRKVKLIRAHGGCLGTKGR